jgi:drug/metabolite transporter (DMT)-like permease
VVIGLAGTYVIVSFGENAQVAGSSPLVGTFLALGAAFAWACYMITTKVLVDRKDSKTGIRYSPEYVTFTTFAVSVIPTLAIVLFTGFPRDWIGGGLGVIDLAYLGVVTSAVAFLIFNIGMKIIGVSRAAVNQLVFPAVAVILSYFLLGQTVNLTEIVGIAMIVVGVLVAQLVGEGSRLRGAV